MCTYTLPFGYVCKSKINIQGMFYPGFTAPLSETATLTSVLWALNLLTRAGIDNRSTLPSLLCRLSVFELKK
jgi:hypothetical protein